MTLTNIIFCLDSSYKVECILNEFNALTLEDLYS